MMTAVFAVALVRLLIYIVAAPNYGYFRDEMYYLACGEHPAWGYMDQPPLIAWMAWLLEHTIGVSLYALRLLPMLADAACIVITALLAWKLGGGRWAMFLASLAVLVAPIYLAFSHPFDERFRSAPVDPDRLVPCRSRPGRQRAKLDLDRDFDRHHPAQQIWCAVFHSWPSGRSCLLAIAPQSCPSMVLGGTAIATLIALPNFLWQLHWNFPFVQLVRSVRENGRDVMLSPVPYLAQQSEMMGFVSSILVILAVWFLISPQGRTLRNSSLGLLERAGVHAPAEGKVLLRRTGLPSCLCTRRGVF